MSFENQIEITPLIEQYLTIKNNYKDAFLLFRLGDFYELFFDDAKKASEILGLTLTSRTKGEKAIPMCGIPYFVATTYISRLLKEGYKVAICEQVGDVKPGKIVERKVIRVITPGTSLENVKELNIDENFICSIFHNEKNWGVAILDVSTGNLSLYEGKEESIKYLINIYSVSEIVMPETIPCNNLPNKIYITKKPDFWFNIDSCISILKEYFHIKELDGLGFNEYPVAVLSLGFLIKYLKEHFLDAIPKIFKIEWINLDGRVFISKQTYQSLEIFESADNPDGLTLLNVINKTLTPMGFRKLKNWMRIPTNDIVELNERLSAIEELIANRNLYNQLSIQLKNTIDLERLTIKITTYNITPQELILICDVLDKVNTIQPLLSHTKSAYLSKIYSYLSSSNQNPFEGGLQEIKSFICKYIDINQDFEWYIKKGIDVELDNLKEFFLNSNKWLNDYIEAERQKSGIPTLKIGYNDIFGYYIEVTKLKAEEVPSYYVRKQTLKNVERYITTELKEFEAKFLRCKEKIEHIEKEIYKNFLISIQKYTQFLHVLSGNIAILDVLRSQAQTAIELNWCKPILDSNNVLYLKNSKHPILEKLLGKKFVPNDIEINGQNFFMLITGPNMAGKSTLIKQVALAVFLAHIGSFVPAEKARIGLVDAIFSRLTTKDILSNGKSTFLVEMLECSQILNLATHKSFVVMDEIGRGTSTYDGLALAVSIINYLVEKIKCRTLFSTHYHELIILENQLQGLVNYHMSVYEWNNELIFLYQLKKGAIDRSFGIYVAKMAGIPQIVLNNAKVFLSKIERKTLKEFDSLISSFGKNQLTLFHPNFEKIIIELKKINYNEITPMEALMKLKQLKDLIDENK